MKNSHVLDLDYLDRLDCETSGVLLFAKTQEAASSLSQQFRDREVTASRQVSVKYSDRNILVPLSSNTL